MKKYSKKELEKFGYKFEPVGSYPTGHPIRGYAVYDPTGYNLTPIIADSLTHAVEIANRNKERTGLGGHTIFSQGVDLRTMQKPKSQCQVCGDFAHVNWAGRCSLCETAEREEERRRRK